MSHVRGKVGCQSVGNRPVRRPKGERESEINEELGRAKASESEREHTEGRKDKTTG